MMDVGDGKYVPLQFGQTESSTEFELDPDTLANELNALDLDVKILDMTKGEIDPSIRHIIADKHGNEKEVFSQSARGSSEYIWRGLRLVTERRMGEATLNDLRKRFPKHNVTLTSKNVQQDAEQMKQYPDAVEYYFSPKPELIKDRRKKHPGKEPKYGESRRTMEQYKRFMAEAKKHNLLNPDESLNQNKLINKLKSMIEDVNTNLFDEVEKKIEDFLEQFVKEVHYSEPKRELIDKMYSVITRQTSDLHKELMHDILKDNNAINSISAEYQGTATILEKLFEQRIYNVAAMQLGSKIPEMVQKAKKENDWPDVEEHYKSWKIQRKKADAAKQREIREQQETDAQRRQSKTPKKRSRYKGRRGKKYLTPAQRHNLRFKKSDWQNIIRGMI